MRCTVSSLLLLLLAPQLADGLVLEQVAATVAVKYSMALAVSPLPTKVATASALAVAGDALAQSREPGPYDTRRAASFVAFDSVYRGAFQHYTFPLIIDACHGDAVRAMVGAQAALGGLPAAIERTAFNQLLVVPVVYYPLFFAITGAVQGLSADGSVQRARENFVPLMQRNLMFWLPVQVFQFACIPEVWQVPFVCAAGLVWNVILSAVAGDCGEEGCSLLPMLEAEDGEGRSGNIVPVGVPAGFVDDVATADDAPRPRANPRLVK